MQERAMEWSSDEVDRVIQHWQDNQKKTVHVMMDKYGQPDEVTQNRVIWHNRSPWKRIVAHQETTRHLFPKPHPDYLEQTIDYRVPPDMADELANFDGSVLFDRTRGEMSARCDAEAANFLAINLANDIIQGNRSVEQARDEYAKSIMAKMKGEKPEIITKFLFQMPMGDTADPDETTIPESEMKGMEAA